MGALLPQSGKGCNIYFSAMVVSPKAFCCSYTLKFKKDLYFKTDLKLFKPINL